MSELVVIAYDEPHRAEEVRLILAKLEDRALIDLEDAVVVRKRSDGTTKLNQPVDLSAAGAVAGGVLGSLVGLLFLNPLLGAAVGASAGAVKGALTDIGIDDDFIRKIAERLQPDSSALFVLVRSAAPTHVIAAIQPHGGTVLETTISHENAELLRSALRAAEEDRAS
jgi:uncharacterized membrane protein